MSGGHEMCKVHMQIEMEGNALQCSASRWM